MGIKMDVAFDQDGREWKADEYHKGKGREPLKCKRCPEPVTHNPSYTRHLHEKSIITPAYFRLFPGGTHAECCPYGVKDVVKQVAAESRELFEKDQNDRYRMRLVMIRDALTGTSSSPSQDGGQRPAGKFGTTYEKSSSKLPGYINSAKRVLKLRALCDSDAEMAEYLELVFEGSTIVHWNQFYFETEQHPQAYHAIQSNTTQHPIALHGFVKNPKTHLHGKEHSNVLNLQMGKYSADPEDRNKAIGLEVSIWSRDADWISDLKEEDEVIVLGIWHTSPGTTTPAKKPGRYTSFQVNRLNLNLSLKAQITKVRS